MFTLINIHGVDKNHASVVTQHSSTASQTVASIMTTKLNHHLSKTIKVITFMKIGGKIRLH